MIPHPLPPSNAATRLQRTIKVGAFYREYKLEGQRGIRASRFSPEVQPRGFDLVVDGWAAAREVSKHLRLDEEDRQLRELLLGREVETTQLTVESIAVLPSIFGNGQDKPRVQIAGNHLVSRFWSSLCRARVKLDD
ncbi:uncharacterized protein JCM6883_007171 [Sporobolomyces salmoneus]|uniref:uncharacterized protein n=1 Tax=Sporobolomyces salmoneus TaxID=183962 RepID=UPI0031717740